MFPFSSSIKRCFVADDLHKLAIELPPLLTQGLESKGCKNISFNGSQITFDGPKRGSLIFISKPFQGFLDKVTNGVIEIKENADYVEIKTELLFKEDFFRNVIWLGCALIFVLTVLKHWGIFLIPLIPVLLIIAMAEDTLFTVGFFLGIVERCGAACGGRRVSGAKG